MRGRDRGALRRTWFVAVLLIALLAACSSRARQRAKGEVTLRFFDRITTIRSADYSHWLVNTFNQRHQSKIHVLWSGTEDQTYKPKINIVLRSHDAPDVFFTWEGGWAQYMIDSGYAAPLDRYYQKYGWDRELNRAGASLARLEGHRYFIPTRMDASVVWYRPDVFKRYGLSIPRSWKQMLAEARKLKAAGITPFILANQKRWPAQFMWTALFVNKFGLSAYDDLMTRKIPWTDPRVVDIFRMMKELSAEGMFEEGANALDVTSAVTLFASGKAAMWYQGSFLLTRFLDDAGRPLFPFAFFKFPPVGSQKATVSVFVEDGLMINRHCRHPDQAAAFLNWVISKQAQERELEIGMPYPANAEVALGHLPSVLQSLGLLIATHSTATFMHIDHALDPAISNPFLDYLQAVLVGAMSPKEAAKLTERAAEDVERTS
ncbi:MAG: ABC transporter substrate-binding protein [Terriglobia bacterium]